MKINEIKKEIVVKTEYVANDGKVFDDKAECEKYEKTCGFVIMSEYKKLVIGYITEYDLFDGVGAEEGYDIVHIATEKDLETVNKAIAFHNPSRRLVSADKIGLNIMVFRGYDGEICFTNTIDNIISNIKKRYNEAIAEGCELA